MTILCIAQDIDYLNVNWIALKIKVNMAASTTAGRSVESRISMVQQSVIKERYYDESDHCQICRLRGKRKVAGYFCTNCNMPLCNSCGDQHKTTDVTTDHDVVPKKHQDGSVSTCQVHRFAAVQFFCETCGVLICVNCTMIDHRQHQIIDVDKKVKECKNLLKETVAELDQKILGFDRELKKISDIEIGIAHSRDVIKEELAVQTEELKKKIDKQHTAMSEQLDKYLDGKTDHLDKRKEVIQKRFDDMMAVRMNADVIYRGHLNSEKFITDIVKIQRQVSDFKPPKEVNEREFTGVAFVLTNNEELGVLEETNKPLIIPQGKKIKYAEKIDHVMLHPANRKRGPVLKVQDPDKRGWQSMKILHKFKTNTYFQNPSGICALPGGKYVIADAFSHGLTICDRTGRYQQRILAAEVSHPNGVAITKDGNIAVTTDKWVKIFKPGGTKTGQFLAPSQPGALQIDEHGNFIVSDVKSRNVTVYNPHGEQTQKFHTTDSHGNGPEPLNLAVGANHIALSYQQFQLSHFIKLFNYQGLHLCSYRLPEACRGIQMDRFGNMIVASGDLCYIPAKGDRTIPLMAVDKRGQGYKLMSHCVAFTQNGHICTLHVNPLSKRSEFIILQIGANGMDSDMPIKAVSGGTARSFLSKSQILPPIDNRPPSS